MKHKNMRYFSYIFIFILIVYSCKNDAKKKNINDQQSLIDKIAKHDKLSNNSDEPNHYFIKLVDTLTKLGWHADTNRINKTGIYSDLKKSKIKIFDNKPFYKIKISENMLFYGENAANSTADEIDFELFRKVKTIWGYFYRQKVESDWIEDGVIEQWKFESQNEAILALNNLKKAYPMPYFNTEPYYSQVDNYLFIFHTRAAAFSYKQKAFYELFNNMLKN
jgi:hypothetical protein